MQQRNNQFDLAVMNIKAPRLVWNKSILIGISTYHTSNFRTKDLDVTVTSVVSSTLSTIFKELLTHSLKGLASSEVQFFHLEQDTIRSWRLKFFFENLGNIFYKQYFCYLCVFNI